MSERPVGLVLDPSALRAYPGIDVGAILAQVADEWRQLAAMADLLGHFPCAAALLVATVHRCNILTAEPHRYTALGRDAPVITL